MKTPYNTSLVPPAPFLSVRVSNLKNDSPSLSIPAKIDTGADITAVPVELVDRLNLSLAGEIQVEGYDRHVATVGIYDVMLQVAHLRVEGVSVIAFAEDYVLLGRDVLNLLRLLLDGPALSLEILPASVS